MRALPRSLSYAGTRTSCPAGGAGAAQARPREAQLAFGQLDEPALAAVPLHGPAGLAALLVAGDAARRGQQQLFHDGTRRVVHQLVNAGLRVLQQLQHRQQRLAAARSPAPDGGLIVAVNHPQPVLGLAACLTILHGGFP
jgi:hypothetical protein